MATETMILKVRGMMCDACAGHVARALTGLDGIESAQVDLAAGTATVVYDSAKTSAAAMKAAIEDEGYDAE